MPCVYINLDDFIREAATGATTSAKKKTHTHTSNCIDVNKIERTKLSNIVVDALTMR